MADPKKPQTQAPPPPAERYDPTEGMTTFEKVAAGAGKAVYDVGRWLGNKVGMVSDAEMEEARKLDAALMNTKEGQIGHTTGQVMMAAATMTGPIVGGAKMVASGGMAVLRAVGLAGGRTAATTGAASTAAAGTAAGTTGAATATAAATTTARVAATTESAGLAARTVNAVKSGAQKVAETAKAARTAPAATAKTVAVESAKATGRVAGKTAVAAAKIGVPLAVADAVVSSAIEEARDGKPKAETVSEVTGIDDSTVGGGLAAAAGATVVMSSLPALQKFGFKVLEHMGGRFNGLIHAAEFIAEKTPGLAKELGHSAYTGATSLARYMGLAYAGGEVAASAYTSADNSADPSRLMLAVDAVRETYADLKRAGLDRSASGSISGALVGAGTTFVSEMLEGMVPGIANITAKERDLLQAKDVDYGNPHMVRLLALHMNGDLGQINRDMQMQQKLLDARFLPQLQAPGMPTSQEEWQAMAAKMSDAELKAHPFYQYDIARIELEQQQRTRMMGFEERWKPAQDRLDAYLTSDRADLGNPAIAALAAARMQDQLAAADRRYQSGIFKEGSLDYRSGNYAFDDPAKLTEMRQARSAEIDALQGKWSGVDQRLAALQAPVAPAAATPEAEVKHAETAPEQAAPVQAAPKPVKAAPPAQHHAKAAAPKVHAPVVAQVANEASPQDAFNQQAALQVAAGPSASMTVTVAGLAPEQLTLPPLVGHEGEHAAVDMTALEGLRSGGLGGEVRLPEPEERQPSQIMALNMRSSSMPGSNIG